MDARTHARLVSEACARERERCTAEAHVVVDALAAELRDALAECTRLRTAMSERSASVVPEADIAARMLVNEYVDAVAGAAATANSGDDDDDDDDGDAVCQRELRMQAAVERARSDLLLRVAQVEAEAERERHAHTIETNRMRTDIAALLRLLQSKPLHPHERNEVAQVAQRAFPGRANAFVHVPIEPAALAEPAGAGARAPAAGTAGATASQDRGLFLSDEARGKLVLGATARRRVVALYGPRVHAGLFAHELTRSGRLVSTFLMLNESPLALLCVAAEPGELPSPIVCKDPFPLAQFAHIERGVWKPLQSFADRVLHTPAQHQLAFTLVPSNRMPDVAARTLVARSRGDYVVLVDCINVLLGHAPMCAETMAVAGVAGLTLTGDAMRAQEHGVSEPLAGDALAARLLAASPALASAEIDLT